MDDFKKLEYESREQYIYRCYSNKYIHNITNRELADIINEELGTDFQESYLRGIYKNYSLGFEDGYKTVLEKSENDIISDIELKRIELEKERKKIQTVKIEYNKMLREQARDELIYEKVKDCIESLEVPEFKVIPSSDNKKEWVLTFGDIHFDKFYESVNNSYSIEEVYRRFNLLQSNLIKIIEKEKIEKLTICNLGDSLEGLLRVSALKTMREGLIESVTLFSRFMAKWLNELSKYIYIDYYHVPTANHMELRLFNQKRGETDENLERLIVNYIHDLLKNNPRINVILTKDNVLEFQLNGFNFLLAHGDGIKNIKSCLKDYSIQRRKFYDYVLLGHFHSGIEQTVAEGETNNMEVIVVPSIIGSDSYSDSLFLGSKSSAKLLGFEEGFGHTDTKTLILN